VTSIQPFQLSDSAGTLDQYHVLYPSGHSYNI
jgi:hypothetical protein